MTRTWLNWAAPTAIIVAAAAAFGVLSEKAPAAEAGDNMRLAAAAQQPAALQTSSLSSPSENAARAVEAARAHSVKGFRSARFGMDETALHAIIAKDLGVKKDQIRVEDNTVQRTRALVVETASLDPGPGRAIVSYVLGYKSRELIQVNVVWGLDEALQKKDTALQDIYAAASILSDYFAGNAWRDGGVIRNAVIDPTTLVMFRGEDGGAGAAEIILGNVPIVLNEEGSPLNSADAPTLAGPSYLRLSYIADRTNPDIYALAKGQF